MEQEGQGQQDVVATLRQIGTLVGQGLGVEEAIRHAGVPKSTYYRWRAVHRERTQPHTPEPAPEHVQRLQRLEIENIQLRRAVADLTLEKQALKEAMPGGV